jgi:hypothetical protein
VSDTAFAAGTVVTSDYLPWARVLAASFAEHHPGVRFVVAVLDEPAPALLRDGDGFELLGAAQIGLGDAELGWLSAIYNGFELSCAVKPWLLRHLLADADAALYLDSDILVTAPLEEIAARAAEHGVVLTPHTLAPPAEARRDPSEDNFLRLGQFNAGFLAVGRCGLPFLDWWGSRLRRECADWSEHEPRRFVDQRWLDLTVNYFPVHVLREPGANVAYWNVADRPLRRGPHGYTAAGEPLLFLHFSGFQPAQPDVFSKHAVPGSAPAAPALLELSHAYAARLAEAGLQSGAATRVASALPGGLPRTDPVRGALRHALLEAERSGEVTAPHPADDEAVLTWLRSPVTPGGTSWYLWGLRAAHAAVRATFAHVPGPDEARYLAWAAQDGIAAGLVPLPVAGGAQPVALDGARGFVTLVSAAEIIADPTLLAGLAEDFSAADDVTFVVHDLGGEPAALEAALVPALAAAGLDGEDAPDVLGLLAPASLFAVAPLVHAVLTRRPAHPALAHLPHAADAETLAQLAPVAAGAR